ncbi:MAG: FtsX-like permease family protein [Acidobacteriaceae bacterium]
MKIGDLTDLALRNLRQAVLRNTLTTAGIAVGVASLVAMLSLGIGLQSLATKQFRKSGLFDTIFVSAKNDPREMERERRKGAAPVGEALPLNEGARAEIAKLPNVLEAYPEIRFYSDVQEGGKAHPTTVSALPESARQHEAFDTMKGKFFSSADASEAIVHKDYAKELVGGGNPEGAIGKDLTLEYFQHGGAVSGGGSGAEGTAPQGFQLLRKRATVRIVGVIDNDPMGGFMGSSAKIWIPQALAESLHAAQPADMRSFSAAAGPRGQYAMLFVRVKGPKNTTSVEEQIKKLGFGAESLLDASKSLQRFFAVLDGFLGIFGSLALAVASLGIINTLVMSILERRREIGIMKAIGASDADVQTLFFAEAAAMGVIGGALGVALGWVIGKGINLGFDAYMRKNQMPTQEFWLLPLWLVGAAIGFSVFVSLAAGLYPARRAARLDPVQALRYD